MILWTTRGSLDTIRNDPFTAFPLWTRNKPGLVSVHHWVRPKTIPNKQKRVAFIYWSWDLRITVFSPPQTQNRQRFIKPLVFLCSIHSPNSSFIWSHQKFHYPLISWPFGVHTQYSRFWEIPLLILGGEIPPISLQFLFPWKPEAEESSSWSQLVLGPGLVKVWNFPKF